jgi:hypothetical protein
MWKYEGKNGVGKVTVNSIAETTSMNVETEMNEYVFWHQQIDKYLTVHYIDK